MDEPKLNLTWWMNHIQKDKKPVVWNKKYEKSYSPFIVNRALANDVANVPTVEQMNRFNNLSNVQQYLYLFHAIKKYTRPFTKGFVVGQKKADEDILMIQTLFVVNMEKACEIMEILSDEQMKSTKARWKALNTEKDSMRKMKT